VIRSSHLVLHEQGLPPATEWAPAAAGWCFLRVKQGDGYLWQQPNPQRLETGDVVVSSQPARWALRASQLGELRVEYFRVYPDLLSGVLTSFERQYLEAAPAQPANGVRYFPAAHPLANQFASFGEQAARQETLLLRSRMLYLLAEVLHAELPAAATVARTNLTAGDRFRQLIMQLPEGDLQHQSPAALAKMCGCSVRHFSRLFKDHFGHSFVPKRTELKLQKARQLLADTDAKIIDVALDSGFQHVGLFTSLFKRHFHQTPSDYRRRMQRRAGASKKFTQP